MKRERFGMPNYKPKIVFLSILFMSLSGCASVRLSAPVAAALKCGPLIPQAWRAPTPPPDPRVIGMTVGGLAKYANDATAAYDVAETKRAGIVQVVDDCETRSAALLDALTPTPWWKRMLHK